MFVRWLGHLSQLLQMLVKTVVIFCAVIVLTIFIVHMDISVKGRFNAGAFKYCLKVITIGS